MRGLDLFHLQTLYRYLEHRPELLAGLEREHGFARVTLSGQARLTGQQLMSLLEALHAEGYPHAAAWMAAQVDHSVAFGLVYFLRSHATLSEALLALSQLSPWLLPDGEFQLERQSDRLVFSLRPLYDHGRLGRLLRYEAGLIWCIGLVSSCLGRAPDVLAVQCMTSASCRADELTALFACDVEFAAARFAVHFTADHWEAPLPGHNPRLLQPLRESLESRLLALEDSLGLVPQLNRWLRRQVQLNQVSLEEAALHFNCSPRTLRRRLADEEVSFSGLVQIQRNWHAFLGVLDRRTPLDEVVTRLGYHDRASFERAFQAAFHIRPAQLRAMLNDVQAQTEAALREALQVLATQVAQTPSMHPLAHALRQAAMMLPIDLSADTST